MAYDLLEDGGQDIRALPQHQRRARLEAVLVGTRFLLSPLERAGSWAELAGRRRHSRALGVEGFMLKRLDAAYGTGSGYISSLLAQATGPSPAGEVATAIATTDAASRGSAVTLVLRPAA